MSKKLVSLLLVLFLASTAVCGLAEGTIADKLNGTKIERLTDTPVTLTAWITINNNGAVGNIIQTLDEMDLLKVMEEKTGVHIDFTTATVGSEEQSFSMMLASRKYPDLIFELNNLYVPGGEAAVDEGIIIDLTPYLEKYAPNYEKARSYSDLRMKSSVTDKGYQPFFCNFSYQDIPGSPDGGPTIRKDLLDKLGMDIPVTYDDWHTFLYRCTYELGLKRTFGLHHAGLMKYNAFNAGFGFGSMSDTVFDPFYQIDGKVMYGPMTDNYKEYLTMMAQWYAEGLIDPDFQSTLTVGDGVRLLSSGECAATSDHGALIPHVNKLGKEIDPDFEFIAVPNPVKNVGDEIHIHSPSGGSLGKGVGKILAISTACKNPELAIRYVDQFFTDEGFMLCNYGTLGKTYNIVDGEPVYTDLIWNNPDYGVTAMLNAYAAPVGWPPFENVLGRDVKPEAKVNFNIWMSNADNAYEYPGAVSLNYDEKEAYAEVFPEIKSYVEEMTVKFIMGKESLDNFDAFREQLRALDVDVAIGAYQSALDRYNSRK